MVHGSRIGQHMSPLVHQAGGVLQPLLTSSEDVRRRARAVFSRACGIATPHTTSCCGHENFNFSKDRHSETLKMIFHTNNTDYDFRYINISNLLQPYIPVLLKAVCVAKNMCGKKRSMERNETVLRFCDSMYLWER